MEISRPTAEADIGHISPVGGKMNILILIFALVKPVYPFHD